MLFCYTPSSTTITTPTKIVVVAVVVGYRRMSLFVRPSVGPSVRPRVRSVAPIGLGGFFPYYWQIITCMKGCIFPNNLWPWPISSRLCSHDIATKLLNYGTSSPLYMSSSSGWILSILAQMMANITGGVARSDIWPWLISSRSFRCDFAIRLWKMANIVVTALQHAQFWIDFFHILSCGILRGCGILRMGPF